MERRGGARCAAASGRPVEAEELMVTHEEDGRAGGGQRQPKHAALERPVGADRVKEGREEAAHALEPHLEGRGGGRVHRRGRGRRLRA